MPRESSDPLNKFFASIGRYFLRRLEMPFPAYKQRIINNMRNLYRVIQPGDVLLVKGRSKISQIIQLLIKSSWSHAALYVGGNLKGNHIKQVRNLLRQLHKTDRQHILIDLALLALPSFLKPFNKRTIQACLGGCTEYKVICSGMIAKAFQSV